MRGRWRDLKAHHLVHQTFTDIAALRYRSAAANPAHAELRRFRSVVPWAQIRVQVMHKLPDLFLIAHQLRQIITARTGGRLALAGRGVARSAGYHRGVGTTCGTLPGLRTVLVPFPLFISSPPTAEPGIMMICADPVVPVTNAGPA
jgi:hypothetical protein